MNRSNARLAVALGASCLLHMLLLAHFAMQRPSWRASTGSIVSGREMRVSLREAPSEIAANPPPGAAPAATAIPPTRAAPATPVTPGSPVTPVTPVTPFPQERPMPRVMPSPAARATRPGPMPKLAEAADAMPPQASTVEEYRLVLAFAVRRFASDALALQGETGVTVDRERRVSVRIEFDAAGHVVTVSLQAASGDDAADRHALRLVMALVSRTPVPQALLGRPFQIDLTLSIHPAREAEAAGAKATT